jgi:acetylornithine deacetylase/succinyl-diaminopimelate desuccinylase-like protein
VHTSGQHQVVFGVRGVLSLEISAYGPQRALHSGHYGNWAPNPIALLTECLAGMRAPDGTIRIEGFHDSVRPISAAERAALAELPAIESDLLNELALAESEAGAAPIMERILLPALNLRGIAGGDVGDAARNAIPTQAQASIDFRLVPDQTPDTVRRSVEQHLRSRDFYVVASEPDVATRRQHARILRLDWGPGYPALRTPMDLDVSRAVVAAVSEAAGRPVLRVPTLGGSLPLHWFGAILQRPLIIVPMVNHDNNQHAPDENLRLQNLWDGIAIYANLMARLGETW